MSFNAKSVPMTSGKEFKRPDPLDPGTYPARLVQVLLLGVQAQRPHKGEEKPPRQEIMLTYEFLDEFLKDEEGNDMETAPRWLSETMPFANLAIEKAKSTQRYYALDNEGEHDGDWSKLIGLPCMLTVIQNQGTGKNSDKVYENISAVSAMRPKEAAKAPPLVNPPKLFDFYSPDMEVFGKLPQWLQDKMKNALDYEGSALAEAVGGSTEASGDSEVRDSVEQKKASGGALRASEEVEEKSW